jgi:hypothetical protein
LCFILPIDSFLESFNYIGIDESDVLTKNFDDVFFLLEGYERVNPVTMKQGKLNYLNKMLERELIDKEEYTKYSQMIRENKPANLAELYHDNKEKDANYFEFNPYTFLLELTSGTNKTSDKQSDALIANEQSCK